VFENAYATTLAWAVGAVIFIIASSLGLAHLARAIVAARGASRRAQSATFAGYLFAAPWIVGFLLFVVAPMGASLYWSFSKFDPPNPPVWVGLDNYIRLLTIDKDLRVSLLNSLYMVLLGLPLQLGVALGLAVLLNQRLPGERVFRAAYYMPVVLALNAAVLLCWRLMLNANNGLINTLLRWIEGVVPYFNVVLRGLIYATEVFGAVFIGLQQGGDFNQFNTVLRAGFPALQRVPLWLQSPLWTKPSFILLLVWSCGTMMLIFLAALRNVPPELHEAAEVDGASAWQRFRHVTLPLISPAMFYNIVVGIIALLQMYEMPYVLTRDQPTVQQSGYFVVYYLWQATFRFNEMGYGAAISWLLLLLILAITLVQFRLQSRWVTYDVR
jgi:multiple sugar transport system permease protein